MIESANLKNDVPDKVRKNVVIFCTIHFKNT